MDPERHSPSDRLPLEIPPERGTERTVAAFVGVAVAAAVFLGLARPADVVAPPARAGAATMGTTIVVHVAGAVRHPGVYELPAGSRVADAIEAAGGAVRAADLTSVNLAAPAVDGAQIALARIVRATSKAPTPLVSSPAQVNLNTADQAALESIPGVGPVTATAILSHRSEIGAFTSLDQLLDVDGIGPATIESLRPYITL
ncbi:MAG: ComEA family DNA-binding protein [Actinomycetota bacterium]|nr:ComEA family DNA-binding protein [Actinomycetota bacterium]